MFEKPVAALLACCCTAAVFSCIPAVQDSGQTRAAQAQATGSSPLPTGPVSDSREIEGKWDIVSFDEYEPARLEGTRRAAFADFTDRGVALRIECNSSGASGIVVDGRFRPTGGDAFRTEIACGDESEARDAALFGFFERAPSVERLPDGRLLLRADGQELVLQRPDQRRLDFVPRPEDLEGRWRLVGVTRYLDGIGSAGIGLADISGLVAISTDRMLFDSCPTYELGYRYTDEGRILKTRGPQVPPSPQGCEALSADRQADGRMPVPWDVMRLLHASPQVEWAGNGDILLSAPTIGLVLSPVASPATGQRPPG